MLFAGLCAGAALLHGCDGVSVSLQLRAGVNSSRERVDTSSIASLHVWLSDGEEKSDYTFDVKNSSHPLDDVTVARSRPFSVDVWGCAEPGACERPSVRFRGCELVDLSTEAPGTSVVVPVDMIEATDDKVAACPPPTTEAD
jgi:hypothetical protein